MDRAQRKFRDDAEFREHMSIAVDKAAEHTLEPDSFGELASHLLQRAINNSYQPDHPGQRYLRKMDEFLDEVVETELTPDKFGELMKEALLTKFGHIQKRSKQH